MDDEAKQARSLDCVQMLARGDRARDDRGEADGLVRH
jgi:hypothetical protein